MVMVYVWRVGLGKNGIVGYELIGTQGVVVATVVATTIVFCFIPL